MMRLRYLLPLGIFLALAVLFVIGLQRDPRQIPSPLIGKPMPEFQLPTLSAPGENLSDSDLNGQVSVLNVFASWCVGCREEHHVVKALAATGVAPVYGLNYKDKRVDAMQWLGRLGNPYKTVAVDAQGQVGIDWGVYGVPETFIMDRHGVIRYKQIGPMSEKALHDKILPLLRKLKQEGES